MTPRHRAFPAALAALTPILFLVLLAGCERSTSGLDPAPPNTDPFVFIDAPGADFVNYFAFLFSRLDALQLDNTVSRDPFAPGGLADEGASVRILVPASNDPGGGFAGGFLFDSGRDLSGYNALSLYARSSLPTASVADIGFGLALALGVVQDAFQAGSSGFDINSDNWTRILIPIPDPNRLTNEKGLFWFADNGDPEGGVPHYVWMDDIQFSKVSGITNPRPAMATKTINSWVGGPVLIDGTQTTFSVQGTDQVVSHGPDYFSYTSGDESVAIADDADITVVGPGSTALTATLGTVPVEGTVTLEVIDAPTERAPVPRVAAAKVISVFSDAYTNLEDTNFQQFPGGITVVDFQLQNDTVKAYLNISFVGIELRPPINAADMEFFHMDVWVPEGAAQFNIKLVDFGEDGQFGGAPDSENEKSFTTISDPALTPGTWSSLEIPMELFMGGPSGLVKREHLAQIIISGVPNVFLDNMYFHK